MQRFTRVSTSPLSCGCEFRACETPALGLGPMSGVLAVPSSASEICRLSRCRPPCRLPRLARRCCMAIIGILPIDKISDAIAHFSNVFLCTRFSSSFSRGGQRHHGCLFSCGSSKGLGIAGASSSIMGDTCCRPTRSPYGCRYAPSVSNARSLLSHQTRLCLSFAADINSSIQLPQLHPKPVMHRVHELS